MAVQQVDAATDFMSRFSHDFTLDPAACATGSQEIHDATLRICQRSLGRVATSAEGMAGLSR